MKHLAMCVAVLGAACGKKDDGGDEPRPVEPAPAADPAPAPAPGGIVTLAQTVASRLP